PIQRLPVLSLERITCLVELVESAVSPAIDFRGGRRAQREGEVLWSGREPAMELSSHLADLARSVDRPLRTAILAGEHRSQLPPGVEPRVDPLLEHGRCRGSARCEVPDDPGDARHHRTTHRLEEGTYFELRVLAGLESSIQLEEQPLPELDRGVALLDPQSMLGHEGDR